MSRGSVTYVTLEGLQFLIRHVPAADLTNVFGSAKRKQRLIELYTLGALRKRPVSLKSDITSHPNCQWEDGLSQKVDLRSHIFNRRFHRYMIAKSIPQPFLQPCLKSAKSPLNATLSYLSILLVSP
jgi:hypothetical protein